MVLVWGLFLKTFHWTIWVCGGSEGVRDRATVSKGLRMDDSDGNHVLLVRQRHGGVQLAWRVFWWLIDMKTRYMWRDCEGTVSSS